MDGTTDIAIGDLLGPNASGVLVLKATADFAVCAIALEACVTNGVEIRDVLWLGPGYFRTLGIPLLAGREFDESDDLGTPKVAIVNETFARKFGLGREAVGKFLAVGVGDA